MGRAGGEGEGVRGGEWRGSGEGGRGGGEGRAGGGGGRGAVAEDCRNPIGRKLS